MNPRLPLCESGDHTRLIYRPNRVFIEKIYAGDLEVSVRTCVEAVRCQLLSVRRAGKGRSKPLYDLPLLFSLGIIESWFCIKEVFPNSNISETVKSTNKLGYSAPL